MVAVIVAFVDYVAIAVMNYGLANIGQKNR